MSRILLLGSIFWVFLRIAGHIFTTLLLSVESLSTHDKIYKVVGKFLSKAICPIPVPPNVIVHPVAWFCATSIILPTGFHKYLHASENISKFLRNLLQGHIFGASICLVFYHFKLAHSRGTTICAQVISDFSICQGQRLCFSCFKSFR